MPVFPLRHRSLNTLYPRCTTSTVDSLLYEPAFSRTTPVMSLVVTGVPSLIDLIRGAAHSGNHG